MANPEYLANLTQADLSDADLREAGWAISRCVWSMSLSTFTPGEVSHNLEVHPVLKTPPSVWGRSLAHGAAYVKRREGTSCKGRPRSAGVCT